jgi:hypothetical protein
MWQVPVRHCHKAGGALASERRAQAVLSDDDHQLEVRRTFNRKIGWAGAVKNLETAIRVGQGRLGAVKDRTVVRAGGHVSNSTLIAENVMKTPVLVPASSPTVSPTKLSFLTGLNGLNKLLFGSK